MLVRIVRLFTGPLLLACLLACEAGQSVVAAGTLSGAPSFSHYFSEWSSAMHVGPPISSTARELGAALSADERTIYFSSDRAGGHGDVDIWVASRDCRDCPWNPALNLGTNINSARSDGGPEVSVDGHYLFFSSNRPGSIGGTDDLWVSHRTNTHDELGWGPAVSLGTLVNSGDQETSPAYSTVGEGPATLYFARRGDIYRVAIAHDGSVLEAATLVPELNHATASDMGPSIRGDGKEIVFWSNRPGGLGSTDLWSSTRQNVNDPWNEPVNLGSTINTNAGDLVVKLSRDGRTLLWSAAFAARAGLGFQDIWMSVRTPGNGH